MAALTVRLSDEKHARLKALAKARGIPLNALIDEMTTQMLAEFDAETRFQVRAMRGRQIPVKEGLVLLNKARSEVTSSGGSSQEVLHERSKPYVPPSASKSEHAGYFALSKSADNRYQFALHSGAHEIILTSQVFDSRKEAENAIKTLQKASTDEFQINFDSGSIADLKLGGLTFGLHDDLVITRNAAEAFVSRLVELSKTSRIH